MRGKFLLLACFLLIFKGFAQEKEVITPPAGPFVKNGYDVFITAAFLYWQAIQERLTYATTGIGVNTSGRVHSIDYPWEPGFRVGIGFYPKHDGWDSTARYTWLHSHSADRASGTNIVPFTLTFDGFSSTQVSQITSARSSWDLHYNVIDLEIGRNFFLSKLLATRLFFGLKGTWINQDWSTRYHANAVTLGTVGPAPGTVTTNQDHDTWGV